MTNKKAVEKLREEFCKLKPFCELYPDTCRKEECEIYMSIEAMELKQRILDNGYTGKEAELRIGGRLFGIREKAQ